MKRNSSFFFFVVDSTTTSLAPSPSLTHKSIKATFFTGSRVSVFPSRPFLRKSFIFTAPVLPVRPSSTIAITDSPRSDRIRSRSVPTLSLSLPLHLDTSRSFFPLKRRVSYSYPTLSSPSPTLLSKPLDDNTADTMLIPKKNRKEVYKHLFKGKEATMMFFGERVFFLRSPPTISRRRRSSPIIAPPALFPCSACRDAARDVPVATSRIHRVGEKWDAVGR